MGHQVIGRERELARLVACLEAAPAGGAVVVVSGEAGVGKSHLLGALATEAQARGASTAIGRAFADVGAAFAPWHEALGDPELGAPAPVGPGASGGAGLGARDDRARTFEAVLSAVGRRARHAPFVLAIEDLQWADADSLALFQHVARFALAGAVVLVGTVRTPDPGSADNPALDALLAELARDPRTHRVALRPFDEEAVGAYVSAIAGGQVPQAMRRHLHAETRGNPLFVREVVRHLVEEGQLAQHDGRLATDFAAALLSIPPSIRDVVRARARRLDDDTRALVDAASVVEEPHDVALLADAGQLPRERAAAAAERALASGLLRSADALGRVEIGHAIVRRALRDALGPERRTALHRAVAEALLARPDPDPAELAGQLHASRLLPGAERGVPYALRAAERAARSGAAGRAAHFTQMALELLPPGDSAEADLAARLALAHADALDVDAATAALERAADAYRRVGRDHALPELIAGVARALATGGVPRAAWEGLVARGLQVLGSTRTLAWAHLRLLESRPVAVLQGPVWVSQFAGFDPEAVALLRERGGELDFAASVEPHEPRSPAETAALRERALGFADPRARLAMLDACARDVFFRGRDLRAAAADADALLQLAERVGSLAGQVSALVVSACAWAALGELGRARDARDRARGLGTRLGAMHRMSLIGPFAAGSVLTLFTGGDWSEDADPLLEVATSPRAAATPFGVVALNLGLIGAAFRGDEALADRLAGSQLEALAALPPGMNEWGPMRDCHATATFHLGVTRYAQRALDLTLGHSEVAGAACWSSAALSEALLRALLGDAEGAATAFAQAREGFAATGRLPSLVLCDVWEATALVRAGARRDPRLDGLLDRAETAAAALGMTPWQRAAAALRQRPEPRSAPPGGLSPREVEVLVQLARGQANKEIAAALFISVPTVERHIANIYAKIGESGRARATAFALKHGLV